LAGEMALHSNLAVKQFSHDNPLSAHKSTLKVSGLSSTERGIQGVD
jgi:hypothetical protein